MTYGTLATRPFYASCANVTPKDADCNCDTRIVRIDWKTLDVTVGPR
jgi:hypothetical protein